MSSDHTKELWGSSSREKEFEPYLKLASEFVSKEIGTQVYIKGMTEKKKVYLVFFEGTLDKKEKATYSALPEDEKDAIAKIEYTIGGPTDSMPAEIFKADNIEIADKDLSKKISKALLDAFNTFKQTKYREAWKDQYE